MGNLRITLHYRLWCYILLPLLAGCAASFNNAQLQPSSTLEMKVKSTINGVRRTALIHLPTNFNIETAYPLVVVIHGAFSTAEIMEQETGFSELADKEQFVVMYPNGMGIFGFIQHWNAGHCCGKAASDDLDDVAFIDECIDTAAQRISIDRKRIYIAGFSNGGMLAYRYASERSTTISGAAALGASAGGRATPDDPWWMPLPPKKPVPLFIAHGIDDQAIPIDGGSSTAKNGKRQYLPLADSISFWLSNNGCSWAYRQESLYNQKVFLRSWQNCAEGSEIKVYTIDGWGHQWPGPVFIKDDSSLAGFDITPLIWDFFKKHKGQ
ncbi:MAG: alpha/beta fold hydrolase [Desulfopila sp.]|nr:alpha/beta fold hydrolase [Desulfopila sp.]